MTWYDQTISIDQHEGFFDAQFRRMEAELHVMEDLVSVSKRLLAIIRARDGAGLAGTTGTILY